MKTPNLHGYTRHNTALLVSNTNKAALLDQAWNTPSRGGGIRRRNKTLTSLFPFVLINNWLRHDPRLHDRYYADRKRTDGWWIVFIASRGTDQLRILLNHCQGRGWDDPSDSAPFTTTAVFISTERLSLQPLTNVASASSALALTTTNPRPPRHQGRKRWIWFAIRLTIRWWHDVRTYVYM